MNEPAFPCVNSYGIGEKGMTLRDHFATEAMNGLIASDCLDIPDITDNGFDRQAKWCYRIADAMLAARQVKTD